MTLDDKSPIGESARRIGEFADAIIEAHELGFGPGERTQPWTLAAQQELLPVWSESLPWEYLAQMAMTFGRCADLMMISGALPDILEEWKIVHSFQRTVSDVIGTACPQWALEVAQENIETGPRIPSVMRFGLVAEVVSEAGAERLGAAASAVTESCQPQATAVLSNEQLAWVRRLAQGDRVLDIAVDAGRSERSLYRELTTVWELLGAKNRNEAIVIASQLGLLIPSH